MNTLQSIWESRRIKHRRREDMQFIHMKNTNPTKTIKKRGKLRFLRKGSDSCSTCGTCRVTLATNPL